MINCLFDAECYEEALEQGDNAMKNTIDKPLLIFYSSARLLTLGKSKEGLLQLETGMQHAPKLIKRFIEFNPSLLQNHSVVEIIARYKIYRSYYNFIINR